MNAALIAAAAAAEEARRREEEEQVGGYSPDELSGNWQFKIVRGRFDTREKVEALMEEQAAHGWTLVEVFDAGRVRFKRPAGYAAKDVAREGNPYATTSRVGGTVPAQIVAMIVVLTSFLAILIAAVAVAVAKGPEPPAVAEPVQIERLHRAVEVGPSGRVWDVPPPVPVPLGGHEPHGDGDAAVHGGR